MPCDTLPMHRGEVMIPPPTYPLLPSILIPQWFGDVSEPGTVVPELDAQMSVSWKSTTLPPFGAMSTPWFSQVSAR
ncbi:hypothetical protein D3C80_1072900 [compost metagenome]